MDRSTWLEANPQTQLPLIDHPKIAVIFATMNRSATAIACVQAIAAQTRPPAMLIVADNESEDGTAQDLEALQALPFKFIVHRMNGNRGNAGGIEEAMEIAFSNGADAVWILDDDSWPRPDALQEMLSYPFDPSIILHPLQIDPKTGGFTWPLRIFSDGRWELATKLEDMPQGTRTLSKGVWTGALVPKKVRDAIGPVRGELFIRGEDEEYPWRMEQAGFTHYAIHNAVMDHPGPPEIVQWSFLGKNFFFEPGLADWKLYYKVRNMVWLKRKQSGSKSALLIFTAYTIAAFKFDGLQRAPILYRAFMDGWKSRLGKMT